MSGKIIDEDILKQLTEKLLQVVADNTFDFVEYDEDSINALFDVESPEKLAYYESLINPDIVSENRLWASKTISEKIAESILQANEYSDDLIKNISSIQLEWCETSLPVTGETNKIYILPVTSGSDTVNTLNIWNATTSAYVTIGNLEIDLSQYYTSSQIDTKLNDKANKTEVLAADKVLVSSGSEGMDTVYSSKLTKDELDKKVNVSDVIDNLTSTDIDKPLSANQGKVLEDKKLNKTDIVTTIDSSSTNDKIPSAKTINTELDKINNNLGEKADVNKVVKKIYIKDVSSEDARTLIQNHWNEFDRFEFYNLRIDTAKWAWNAEIYSHTQEYGTVLLMSYGSDVPRIFYGKLYNNVWTWKELATVDNAKDVGVTTITPVNSAITGTIEYTVKNGICYVSLFDVKSTTNSNDLSISTTMPKPAINSSSAIVKNVGNGNIGFVYINKNTTQLTANIYIADIIGSCSFSYPVAE